MRKKDSRRARPVRRVRKVRPVRPVRPVAARHTSQHDSNRVTAKAYDQRTAPLREWDRGTQFLSVFAVSGFIAEQTPQGDVTSTRPASVVLVGTPGSGKTELIERFRRCRWLSYHNDLTLRPLLTLLTKAHDGLLTHVAAPEFNKWFQRKGSVAENCVGMLSSAMEEGVTDYDVGPVHHHWPGGARLGIFGGMTPGTMERRRFMLAEMGFLTRASVIEWTLPRKERDEITRRMNLGILDDLDPIDLPRPEVGTRATIAWDEKIGELVLRYIRERWPSNDLRTFKRFKAAMLARAYLVGKTRVSDDEWQWLQSYDDYWGRMILGDE